MWKELRHLGLIKARKHERGLLHTVEELGKFFAPGTDSVQVREDSIDDILSGVFNEENFHWRYVTPISITRVIARIRSNAVGADEISLVLLTHFMHYLMPILEHLLNLSLISGVFPSQWKTAIVCPIPKIRSPMTVKDYRPISVLPVLAKVMESVACEQLQGFLEDSNLYDQYQSAYRNNHSVQTSLIRMIDDVRQAANKRMITVSILFDFSKAFDRMNHLLLIRKLKHLNLSDGALKWVHLYLTGRTQVIVDHARNTCSSGFLIRAEVPQGSVLGPLLFVLYLSDFSPLSLFSLTTNITFMRMIYKYIYTVNRGI